MWFFTTAITDRCFSQRGAWNPYFHRGMAGHGALRKLRLWLLLFLRGEPRFWPMNWNRFQRFYKRWEAVSAGHISCLARDFMGICEIQEVVIQCYSVIQQSSMTGDRNETKYTRSGWIIRDSRFCSDSLTAVLDLNSRKPGAGSRVTERMFQTSGWIW